MILRRKLLHQKRTVLISCDSVGNGIIVNPGYFLFPVFTVSVGGLKEKFFMVIGMFSVVEAVGLFETGITGGCWF